MEEIDEREKRSSRKQKTDKGCLTRLCMLLAILVITGWIVSAFFSSGESDEGKARANVQDYSAEDVPDWITQKFLSVNEYSRPGTPLKEINGIVVHYVANPGSTGWNNWHYFEGLAESHERKAGAHFIIGLDGTIIQCVPLNELTYCSNSRNVDTVSIECCHKREDGKFEEATYDSLVKLCRWLMDRYGLETEDVIRHYDVTGKLCPLYFVEHEDAWEAFRKELE